MFQCACLRVDRIGHGIGEVEATHAHVGAGDVEAVQSHACYDHFELLWVRLDAVEEPWVGLSPREGGQGRCHEQKQR